MKNNQKLSLAFSTVELLISISIIGILFVLVLPQYIDYRKEAKITVTHQKLADLRESLVGNPSLVANGKYIKPGLIRDIGQIPTSLDDLVTQGSYDSYDPLTAKGWRGPYVENRTDWNKDAWGNSIILSTNGRVLLSSGPDGVLNTNDDIVSSFSINDSEICKFDYVSCPTGGGTITGHIIGQYIMCNTSCYQVTRCVGGTYDNQLARYVLESSLENCL